MYYYEVLLSKSQQKATFLDIFHFLCYDIAIFEGGRNMFYLLDIEENEKNFRLYFEFYKSHEELNENDIIPILLNHDVLSSYENFKLSYMIRKQAEEFPSTLYLFGVGTKIVGTVYVMQADQHTANISCIIQQKYRKKGYGTIAIKEMEKLLFQNPEIYYAMLSDISNLTHHTITPKIAESLGYKKWKSHYIKENPNITIDLTTEKFLRYK